MRLLLLVAALAGCAPASWDDFWAELHQRACDRSVACGEVAASERALCRLPAKVTSMLMRSDFDVWVALAAGHMTYVPDGAARCLDAVGGAACDDGTSAQRIELGCNNVLRPATTVGNLCWAGDQCQGGECVQDYDCLGSCVGYPAPGAPCVLVDGDPTHTCDPTVAYCDGATCRQKKQLHAACMLDDECSFGLVCSSGACASPPSLRAGDVCIGDVCAEHVYCDGRCIDQATANKPCDSLFGCERGLSCIGLVVGNPVGDPVITGVCRPWLDVGAACDGTVTVSGCPLSTYCLDGVCSADTDDKVSGFGASCDDRIACANGLVCVVGICREKSGRAGTCADDNGCSNGLSCDANHLCVSRLTCVEPD